MKHTLRFVAAVLTVLLVSALFAACGTDASIDYGEKYTDGNAVYVFHSNETGYCEIHNKRDDGVTVSKRHNFIWSVASDGSVHLFALDTVYYDDHTSTVTSNSLIAKPLWFGDDFFYYQNSNQYGTSRIIYIEEDSDLFERIREGNAS